MDRALCVGINAYPTSPLPGCVNDAATFANCLVNVFGFPAANFSFLVDEKATKRAIMTSLEALIQATGPADRAVFFFAGHGAQVPSMSEPDGLDEIICPVDIRFTEDTMIRDDELQSLFAQIKPGAKFVAVFDSCSSGGLSRFLNAPALRAAATPVERSLDPPLDLLWQAELRRARAAFSGVSRVAQAAGSNAVVLSACRAEQKALDFPFFGVNNGVFTKFLTSVFQANGGPATPLTNLVPIVRNSMLAYDPRFVQEPQLDGPTAALALAFLA